MKKFLSVLRVAWDDRFCRSSMCLLAFMAAISGERLAPVILMFALFMGTAAAVAFAAGGKDELEVRLHWVNAVWFGAMFLGLLYGVTIIIAP